VVIKTPVLLADLQKARQIKALQGKSKNYFVFYRGEVLMIPISTKKASPCG
jgi:hypothetical protein